MSTFGGWVYKHTLLFPLLEQTINSLHLIQQKEEEEKHQVAAEIAE